MAMKTHERAVKRRSASVLPSRPGGGEAAIIIALERAAFSGTAHAKQPGCRDPCS